MTTNDSVPQIDPYLRIVDLIAGQAVSIIHRMAWEPSLYNEDNDTFTMRLDYKGLRIHLIIPRETVIHPTQTDGMTVYWLRVAIDRLIEQHTGEDWRSQPYDKRFDELIVIDTAKQPLEVGAQS